MFLQHGFSTNTRELFRDTQYCWKCKCNGNGKGGLEIHHICGRNKNEMYLDSPFNASVLCKECHDHISHGNEERLWLFKYTISVLLEQNYKPVENDINFINSHAQDKFRLTPQELFKIIINHEPRRIQETISSKTFQIR